MPKRKAAKNCVLLPWCSAKQDCKEGRFVQIGNSVFTSEAVAGLSPTARWVYLCFIDQAAGQREFSISATAFEKLYHIPKRSFFRAVEELERQGFVNLASGQCTRTKNEYAFCFAWKGFKEL